MRGAATQSMSDIVEERQQRRYAPFAAAPRRAAARRPAGPSPCSHGRLSMTLATDIPPRVLARRSRLASGPGGLQQNVKLFLREPLGAAVRHVGARRPWIYLAGRCYRILVDTKFRNGQVTRTFDYIPTRQSYSSCHTITRASVIASRPHTS